MMLLPLAMLLAASQPITVQAPSTKGEVGYATGALAYDALMSRDYAKAEHQLLSTPAAARADAAWLINFGQVLMHTGRFVEGQRMLRRAAEMNDGELILSDGRTVSARDAALLTLQSSALPRQASR